MIGISLFQSVALGSFWIFINMIQMLFYLPTLDCILPYNFEIFISEYMSIKDVSIPFNILPDFLWNPLNIFSGLMTLPFNERLFEKGYESLSFLYNFGNELLTWILLAIGYGILVLATKFIPKSR